jgi:hypothetical protein
MGSSVASVGVEMPKWVTKMTVAPRRPLIVGRTDSECKYAYDRKAHVSKLDKALHAAAPNNWTVTSMKDDWKRDFAFA